MSLKHGILGLLTYEDMSGYDLSKYFDKSLSFFWNAQRSQIYRELGKLEDEGLAEVEVVHQEDKPDKKLYSITEKGYKKLIEWVNQFFLEDESKTRDPFLMRIFFGAIGETEKLKEGIKEFKKKNEFYKESLKQIEKKFIQDRSRDEDNEQIYWLLTIKKGYYNFEANISWAEEVLEIIEDF